MKTKEITKDVKNLIQMNVTSEDFRCVPGIFGKNDHGQWGYLINWDDMPDRYVNIVEENMRLIHELTEARNSRSDILVGDYLEMPDRAISRVTYCHDEGVQDGGGSGSFYLLKSGQGSYSGVLNGIKPLNKIRPTDKTKPALFWIFSRNQSGGNRGFNFYIDVRIWKIDSMFKTAYVKFDDFKYNYHTSINGKLSDDEIKEYFIGQWLNLGSGENDDIQKCTDCAVYY